MIIIDKLNYSFTFNLITEQYLYLTKSEIMKKLLVKILQTSQFFILTILRKAAIGKQKYAVHGIIKNKLAVAALEKNYEAWADIVFSAIFRIRDGAFIDVGANTGQTLIKILSIDNKRQYIGFEPQIAGCFFIDKFIKDNALSNHTILPLGLSDREGLVKLGMRESCDVTASMVNEYRPDGFYLYYQYIPVVPGDNILPIFELPSLSIIKIDVEGGELDVINGLENTIKAYMPYIFFEVLPHYLFVTQQELDEDTKRFRDHRHAQVERVLVGHSYVIYQVQPEEGLRKVNTLKAAKRQLFYYVAVPSKEEKKFIEAYPGSIASC